MNNLDIVDTLLNLARKASLKGEIPVSAIIICNDKIISKKFNLKEKKNDSMAHAEILAIKEATKKLKRWNLNDCSLYVTLKPCAMCEEVIKQSRIKTVYYLLDKLDYKHDFTGTSFEKINLKEYKDSYQQLLSAFFKNMR